MKTQESGIDFKIKRSHEGIHLNSKCFPSHFLACICAKPGAGKTALIKFLLNSKDLFFKKYDYIFIVSPSGITEYAELFLPQDNIHEKYDISWINDKIKSINDAHPSEYINVLFILDDVIGSVNSSRHSESLMSFVFNRRHIINNGMVSIIITTQKFNVLPTCLRAVMNVLILFSAIKREIEVIKDNLIYGQVNFDEICEFCFKNDCFLIYNITDGLFFKNFDNILI